MPNAKWIGYFDTALNENGKADLVMANSASDAGDSELEIRKRMIQDGIISQMVTLPSNIFYTVTLPATLWLFNKRRTRKDEILLSSVIPFWSKITHLCQVCEMLAKNLASAGLWRGVFRQPPLREV